MDSVLSYMFLSDPSPYPLFLTLSLLPLSFYPIPERLTLTLTDNIPNTFLKLFYSVKQMDKSRQINHMTSIHLRMRESQLVFLL